MAQIKIEGHIVEDEGAAYLGKTNIVFNELAQLQQKYGVNFSISIEPFENSSFFDLFIVTKDEFENNDFVSEMEDVFLEYKVTYIYKNVTG